MQIRLNLTDGPSGKKSEHLRIWHRAENWYWDPDPRNWDKVVSLIQAAFRGGELAAPYAWQMVVIIPKGEIADSRGVGLLEVLWKAIYGIINRRLLSSIQFHDVLHGFCAGRGKGTATFEATMLQKLISKREKVLHAIFLDLRKYYDALDRDRCLDILEGYGVGPRMLRILRTYWVRLQIASKAGGHYGPILQIHSGVTQGGPLSPTIFNVAVDDFIRN